tara:strand:+ start:103 stop:276 length:174 start_codon:yes stop_codon:yes gene_type:complete
MPDASLLFAVLGYGACSSLMLVVNKLAVHHLPAPSFVLLAQVLDDDDSRLLLMTTAH